MRQLEIILAVSLVSMACSVLGPFLILRKMSMMIDSITHTILLGIVIGVFITRDLTSPLLIFGATVVGVFTVFFTELLNDKTELSEDSAIGLVFPFLFSIAIILISKFMRGMHIDVDSVLVGEVAFSVIPRFEIFGYTLGSKVVFIMAFIFLINLIFVFIFFKELKISTFDKNLSSLFGFKPQLIYYMLMILVSVTTVGSFNAVGSVLVISFMVVPSSAAYLITDDLKKMIAYSLFFGIFCSIAGSLIAYRYDFSIAGTVATFNGFIFFLLFIFNSKSGVVKKILDERNKKFEFAEITMMLHLINHETDDSEVEESGLYSINEHLCYEKKLFDRTVNSLLNKKYCYIQNGVIKISDEARKYTLNKYNEWMN